MQELIAYLTFSFADEAEATAEELKAAGIEVEIVKKNILLDSVITGASFEDDYILRIPSEDFSRANKLLFKDNLDSSQIDPDHPLRAMSTDELKDIIAKPDEWGATNVSIAMALLKSRGVTISEQALEQIKEQRANVVAEKKSLGFFLLFIGYFTALAPIIRNIVGSHRDVAVPGYYLSYLPGVAGLLIGWIAISSKTTLPDGSRVLAYNNTSIKHGVAILILNCISWVINIAVAIYVFS